MKAISKIVFFLFICSAISLFAISKSDEGFLIYNGTSDASAAVSVSKDMFIQPLRGAGFIVADDENNVLRVYPVRDPTEKDSNGVYKTSGSSVAVFSYDVTEFLGIEPEHPEADIEGATMVGDRIYWITSHGRNKDGKNRPNRYRFFATSVTVQNQNITIKPVGIPCRTLIHRLIKTASMRRLELDKSTQFGAKGLTKKDLKKLAPKREGLNIEGLCASADGTIMYIGFRNPRPVNKKTGRAEALVVPLKNAKQVIEDAEKPIFGEPILWDLGGLGIRSMEYSDFHKTYFIIAGAHNEDSIFALYRWTGKKDTPPSLVQQIDTDKYNLNPEVLVTFENCAELLLLSDDGILLIDVSDASECMEGKLRSDGKCLNKHLVNRNKKYFRGSWLTPQVD